MGTKPTISFKYKGAMARIYIYHNAVQVTYGPMCFHLTGITGELRDYIEATYRNNIDKAQAALRC
jgi:hypothetical protein